MNASDKAKGFKPGANMPDGDYDPKREGMSESGNHATGHPGNDVPGNIPGNKQSAEDTATATTRRDRNAGARGDDSTHTSNKSTS